ncbi:hypothetical protein JOD57_003315 [Geodermatophilus bullaregiensis]|uniref:hypothetical protein n=1 Tax=Geodermatophilus bullaregiensis TaxID=1564160 RepID=UPI0019593745|nr:hypothetical protein [Geodermatophilus bullaregiensis]MBM7807478.1 hypothetical protein [Geodermatophilus bullaregiensis]
MSQPPYPPQGGNDPSGRPPGQPGWGQSDDPARQPGQPAPPTAQFPPGQFGPPGGEREQTAPFGQPAGHDPQQPYGQQPYGQPGGHDPNQYGQQYGPQYGQPHGQQYGYDPNQPYGQQPYGQPGGYDPQQQYGQPYGQPGFGQPQPPTGRRNLVVALSVAGVLLIAGLAVGLFFLLRGDDTTPVADPTTSGSASSSSPSSGSSSSSPSSPGGGGAAGQATPPTGLGPDPDGRYQPLAEACFDGDLAACDDLWRTSPTGSQYEQYAGTCAGRVDYEVAACEQRLGDGGGAVTPTDPAPPTGLGDDPLFQQQAEACFAGDYAVCDDLWRGTPVGSDYEQYAGTCAGRLPYEELGTCESRLTD